MTATAPGRQRPLPAGATSEQRALGRSELLTTAFAVVVSSAGYVTGGYAYLARGVVGDLLGFAVLAAVLLTTGRRLRHEALLCLLLIGVVLLARPQWPLRLAEGWWWLLWSAGFTCYLLLRQPRLRGRREARPARAAAAHAPRQRT